MSENIITTLKEYVEKIKTIENREQLKMLNCEYSAFFHEDSGSADTEKLKERVYAIVSELVILREERTRNIRSSTDLSESEHSEIYQVQRLIDFNLFTYHFQPIVRADNGEIYSYEALMRAKDMQGITPFHILKYAELTDRLAEVEQYTFLNVLGIIDRNRELFEGKLVFINSMPNVHIDPERSREIGGMLSLLSDKVVVEMTENSEYNDAELNVIKEKYRGLNIRIAIDDYGTGYSNISNLLRYTPNYVKIDRALLSGIQNNPNKKHFVREIIDFCHDNNILALAEGVESSEELRTVILLGADLIQGFYLARPAAEVIPTIPYELKAEIRSHRMEREEGRRLKIYNAESGERVSLDKVYKDGCTLIRIGAGYSQGTVTVAGIPNLDPGIHIETAEGFTGRIVLDSVRLSDLSGKPCIDIGERCCVSLILIGNSRLSGGGIRVPASSKLTTEGDGNMEIHLGGTDYYGIGNDLQSVHGELIFEQDGTISISSESHSGVCIGSGLGGSIKINRGRYVLRALGSMSVCIGAYDGDASVDLLGCDVDAVTGGAHSAVVGSLNGNADISAMYSSIKCRAGSILAAAFGTVTGERATVKLESISTVIDMSAEEATAFGAVQRSSDVQIIRSSVNVRSEGAMTFVFGSSSGQLRLALTDMDLTAELASKVERCFIADPKNVIVSGGKYRIKINGRESEKLI